MFETDSFIPFVQRLFNHIIGYPPGDLKNICVSPICIYSSLLFLLPGSSGITRTEILAALRLDLNDDFETVFTPVLKVLRDSFVDTDTNIIGNINTNTLLQANGIFMDCDLTLQENFEKSLIAYYDGKFTKGNFSKNALSESLSINKWVAERTNKNIFNLLSENIINDHTQVIVINAIYFKGFWKNRFNRDLTQDGSFKLLEGSISQISFMHKKQKFKHAAFPEFKMKALKLPLETHEMLILLPDAYNGLQIVLDKLLDRSNKSTFISLFNESSYILETIILGLPKFKIGRYAYLELSDRLSKMEMSSLFNASKADFTGFVGDKNVCLSNLVHQVLIEVNEDGVGPAPPAVDDPCDRPLKEPIEFLVDHPFSVIIISKIGLPIFFGNVVDPSKEA